MPGINITNIVSSLGLMARYSPEELLGLRSDPERMLLDAAPVLTSDPKTAVLMQLMGRNWFDPRLGSYAQEAFYALFGRFPEVARRLRDKFPTEREVSVRQFMERHCDLGHIVSEPIWQIAAEAVPPTLTDAASSILLGAVFPTEGGGMYVAHRDDFWLARRGFPSYSPFPPGRISFEVDKRLQEKSFAGTREASEYLHRNRKRIAGLTMDGPVLTGYNVSAHGEKRDHRLTRRGFGDPLQSYQALHFHFEDGQAITRRISAQWVGNPVPELDAARPSFLFVPNGVWEVFSQGGDIPPFDANNLGQEGIAAMVLAVKMSDAGNWSYPLQQVTDIWGMEIAEMGDRRLATFKTHTNPWNPTAADELTVKVSFNPPDDAKPVTWSFETDLGFPFGRVRIDNMTFVTTEGRNQTEPIVRYLHGQFAGSHFQSLFSC